MHIRITTYLLKKSPKVKIEQWNSGTGTVFLNEDINIKENNKRTTCGTVFVL